MLIIEVKDENEVSIKAEGTLLTVNTDLIYAIRTYHDLVIEKEENNTMKRLKHKAVVEAVQLAYNLIND